MLGAVIGDVVGSIYEWNNIKSKDFPLFTPSCFFTDDTVMTFAIAEGIMDGGKEKDFIARVKEYGRAYPNLSYGTSFRHYLFTDTTSPYNSYGNGAAMRVSPCAYVSSIKEYIDTGSIPQKVHKMAVTATAITHNHSEGIKGALATVDAIYLARYYFSANYKANSQDKKPSHIERMQKIKEYIEAEYGYNLSRKLDDIRPNYSFDESCQGTVPEAIIAFLESISFEDAVRNAISLGGDSDTLAAITVSIAEAAYGVPSDIRQKVLTYLPSPLLNTFNKWEEYVSKER